MDVVRAVPRAVASASAGAVPRAVRNVSIIAETKLDFLMVTSEDSLFANGPVISEPDKL